MKKYQDFPMVFAAATLVSAVNDLMISNISMDTILIKQNRLLYFHLTAETIVNLNNYLPNRFFSAFLGSLTASSISFSVVTGSAGCVSSPVEASDASFLTVCFTPVLAA